MAHGTKILIDKTQLKSHKITASEQEVAPRDSLPNIEMEVQNNHTNTSVPIQSPLNKLPYDIIKMIIDLSSDSTAACLGLTCTQQYAFLKNRYPSPIPLTSASEEEFTHLIEQNRNCNHIRSCQCATRPPNFTVKLFDVPLGYYIQNWMGPKYNLRSWNLGRPSWSVRFLNTEVYGKQGTFLAVKGTPRIEKRARSEDLENDRESKRCKTSENATKSEESRATSSCTLVSQNATSATFSLRLRTQIRRLLMLQRISTATGSITELEKVQEPLTPKGHRLFSRYEDHANARRRHIHLLPSPRGIGEEDWYADAIAAILLDRKKHKKISTWQDFWRKRCPALFRENEDLFAEFLASEEDLPWDMNSIRGTFTILGCPVIRTSGLRKSWLRQAVDEETACQNLV